MTRVDRRVIDRTTPCLVKELLLRRRVVHPLQDHRNNDSLAGFSFSDYNVHELSFAFGSNHIWLQRKHRQAIHTISFDN